MNALDSTSTAPLLSVVIPVCNEAGNVVPLAREIQATLASIGLFEIIFVDDGSTDGTVDEVLTARREGIPQIRLIRHAAQCGQSIALHTGVKAARAAWIVSLDGDGQNDPVDIPRLLHAKERAGEAIKLVMGHRRNRQDTWKRKISSRIANAVRSRILKDSTPDASCGIKLFERSLFLELPAFNHMHRFLPALFIRAGAQVMSLPVSHRRRERGESKYGIRNRLWVGIVDLLGVRWLIKRTPRSTESVEEGF